MASDKENKNRETRADIVRELRRQSDSESKLATQLRKTDDDVDFASASCYAEDARYLSQIADRIEAACKREATAEKSSAVGNAAACKKRDEVVLRLSKEEYKGMQEALSEHDRLCEMLSESRMSVGNAAAMRDALLNSQEYAAAMDVDDGNVLAILDACRDALSAPARNCDVGTADEQAERFHAFCDGHSSGIGGMCDGNCPCFECVDGCYCLCKWAQIPYEAQEGGTK